MTSASISLLSSSPSLPSLRQALHSNKQKNRGNGEIVYIEREKGGERQGIKRNRGRGLSV
jgi:hypothetical protein